MYRQPVICPAAESNILLSSSRIGNEEAYREKILGENTMQPIWLMTLFSQWRES